MRRGGIVKITVGGKRVAVSNRSKGRRKRFTEEESYD